MSAPIVTPERLFSEPPLNAAIPQKPLLIEGDRPCLLFLMPRADAVQLLDLWRCDIAAPLALTEPGSEWLRSEDLAATIDQAEVAESEAERAERERLRQFASGITQFLRRPEHREILVVAQGQGISVDLDSGAATRLTQASQRHAGFTFSPRGNYLSYVRDGNLYVLTIASGSEQQITFDATSTVFSGLPDFIAQEEMHRFTGHWWRPDESAVAFQRTDMTPVPVAYRHDIQADSIEVIEQRYPYAGGPNAEIQLGVWSMHSDHCEWLDYRSDHEDYLARVQWIDDDLYVQCQSRDQQRLELKRFAQGRGAPILAHRETSATWINLHDNLHSLPGDRLCWTSEANGLSQLLIADNASAAAPLAFTALTGSDLHVTEVHGQHGEVLWFSGWRDNPTELHLFCCTQDAGEWQPARAVTTAAGWHQCSIASDGTLIADLHSSLEQPPTLTLRGAASGASTVVAGGPVLDTHPYHPFLAAHQTPRLGTLTGSDGAILHYRLTRPATASSARPVPAIVYVYGGPGGARVHNAWAPLLLQLLSSADFAVLELDNRGTGNRGPAFDAGIYQALGTVEVEDQLVGTRWLASQDWIAADRIGVFGHSYGGFMTLKCLLAAPELFAAGVSVAPVTDWRLYDTHYTERYLGHPAASPDAYRAAGLLGHSSSLQRPLLLMHGMADDNVLFANTTALIAELQQHLVPFELMTYPGAKHALQEPHVSTHRFRLLLDFFNRHL